MSKKETLDEFMQSASDRERFYIGSANSWFFIGTKAKYYEMIDKISDDYERKFKKMAHEHEVRRESLRKKVEEFERKKDKDGIDETDEKMAKRLLLLAKAWSEEIKIEINARERYRKYTPLRTREVKETYQKSIEPGTAVIIKGTESADYWDLKEWNRDHAETEWTPPKSLEG